MPGDPLVAGRACGFPGGLPRLALGKRPAAAEGECALRFDNERQNGGAAPYWGRHRRVRLPAHAAKRLAYRQDLRAAGLADPAGPGQRPSDMPDLLPGRLSLDVRAAPAAAVQQP